MYARGAYIREGLTLHLQAQEVGDHDLETNAGTIPTPRKQCCDPGKSGMRSVKLGRGPIGAWNDK